MDIRPPAPRPRPTPAPPSNPTESVDVNPVSHPNSNPNPNPNPIPTSLVATDVPAPQPIGSTDAGLQVKKPKNKKKLVLFSILGFIFIVLLALGAGVLWYTTQLSALKSDKNEYVKVEIKEGSAPATIGQLLVDKGIIRSNRAFSIYTRVTKTQNKLQAGVYRLSPSETTPEIVKHLTSGNVDTISIQFLPGATLAEDKKVLLKAGYTQEQIDTAFAASYDSPLFDTKPATSDLEGYIYGETYTFSSDATVGDILTRTFAQYEQIIKENDFVAKFQSHGLSLYQGITLASIIQREAIKGDEPQIAQVFYSRLAMNMPLGSDVTYQYIADKTGVERDPNLDSPYNTRRYTGLPPGPISMPGIGALKAVAEPAAGDYLYFLSGDDDVTYYAHTLDEHEANISAHCKVKCSTL